MPDTDTAIDVLAFAEEWVAAWNGRGLDRVLKMYAEDFSMASPGILRLGLSPDGKLRGKAVVRHYWQTALGQQPDLHFTLMGVYAGPGSVVIHYHSSRGHDVMESFVLNPDGLITTAAANHPVA